ncbi:cytosolic Fe-S cluster assembly factor NAR1 [Plasmodium gonderi]|uniref:Cytosolic Fe-S cluster assembly factor NAR1 n=1 Tax=Plasmodium gonderi TaxID=77519 RepID=A0A1Y1JH86_PLAGO|nr:cytosolic Fe-S cluster assembly factor NAR1 [Plasmodium gonderi]GAW81881.1 cytosolic Fe-S cluster assembly factor NAR1 [Plasmodium gonderi]
MFSNAIKLENLNDYNNDAEECIKPFLYKSNIVNEADLEKPNLISINKKNKKKKKERGEISLTDCLACSGCVTNEETNFLKSQNAIEILNHVKKKKINIISLSLQSVTALSVYYNLPIWKTQKKLSYLFKSLNFDYVYDSSVSELIALNESKKEFMQHFSENIRSACIGGSDNGSSIITKYGKTQMDDIVYTPRGELNKNNFNNFHDSDKLKRTTDQIQKRVQNVSKSAKKTHTETNTRKKMEENFYDTPLHKKNEKEKKKKKKKKLPLICSHCSGTVIYGEKNFDEELLNSFSEIKSSQDIQGIILKILHLQNTINVIRPLLEKSPFKNFFNMCNNYESEFLSICRKHFFKNHNFLKSDSSEGSYTKNATSTHVGKRVNDKANNDHTISNMVSPNIYDINHVYLLYCFDKKLEAHRSNLAEQNSLDHNIYTYISNANSCSYDSIKVPKILNENEKKNFYCVDAVLTTVELVELIKNLDIDFISLAEIPIDNVYNLLKKTQKSQVKMVKEIQVSTGISKLDAFVDEEETYKYRKGKCNKMDKCFEEAAEECTIPPMREARETNLEETLYMDYSKHISNYELDKMYDELENYALRCSSRNNISVGYGEEIFKYVCKHVFNFRVDENEFHLKYHDIVVLSLIENGHCVFRVILSYGFKSMYNVIKKLKERKNENMPHINESVQPEAKNTQDNPSCGVKKYDVKITYNLQFIGRIDYIELMACEKGCLFGCAQNIFSERVHTRSICSCYNSRIFKKIAEQEVIENFDFLHTYQKNNGKKKLQQERVENVISCSSKTHENCKMHAMDYDTLPHAKRETQNGYDLFDEQKVNTEKLFQKLYDTMHSDKFTLYVNSNICEKDFTITSFLKNIGNFFNTETFHILKRSFLSKKKVDIINW